MYDVYNDIAVVPQKLYYGLTPVRRRQLLTNILKKNFKKIFLRSKVTGSNRVYELKWISPYPEPPYSTRYIHKEGSNLIYGDLTQAYYSPRYHYERIEISDLLSPYKGSNLILIGSGISPYTLFLKDFNVIEYEPNLRAVHYGYINLCLNNYHAVTNPIPYDGSLGQITLSMMPSVDLNVHKTYNFSKVLVFYVLLDESLIENYVEEIEKHYGKTALCKKVRKYSTTKNVYRLILR